MDYENNYQDYYMWMEKVKSYKEKAYKVEKIPQEPVVDVAEKSDPYTDISQDTLLVAKQFMVFAHIRCPKPPIRYAKGLLQSTIRAENTSYLGMGSVNVYVGNEKAFYMPFTNEEWHSAKAYPVGRESFYKKTQFAWRGNWEKNMKEFASYMAKEYNQDEKEYFKKLYKTFEEQRATMVRKNPNEHWWDKAIQDTVNLCQERGVMMNG